MFPSYTHALLIMFNIDENFCELEKCPLVTYSVSSVFTMLLFILNSAVYTLVLNHKYEKQ